MVTYESVIGLEVHAELLTQAKIFCPSSAHFGGAPNTHVGPISLGLPGTLPVLNQAVLTMAIQAGLATNCQIARRTKFDRKHYFYPDLPKGYQITQYDQPIAEHGRVSFELGGREHVVRLNRIHMEEDAGKLVHAGADRLAGSTYSLADYNRAGVPLLEIVSEPDLRSSTEARAYLEELRSILMAIGVCDGKMEEGSLRCDANVSIRPLGSEVLGTRVELKNINSFRYLTRAIDYEIARQEAMINAGETVVQETRLWDEHSGRTITMRSKEEAHDYRYFPDPDLVFFQISEADIEETRARVPELPAARRERYIQDFGLAVADARILVAEAVWADFFESTVAAGAPAVAVSRWLLGDIAAYLNDRHLELGQTALTPAKLADMLLLLERGTISGKIAKTLLEPLLESDQTAEQLVAEQGLTQISDTSALDGLIQQVLAQNPNQVQQFLAGKEKVMGFLVGQLMKVTQGRADPAQSQQLLRQHLEQLRG